MSHERFFNLLDRYPRIRHLWNKEKGEIDLKNLSKVAQEVNIGGFENLKYLDKM